MNRRGQAALEFLMTYGWAILVVLIAIGALAYFGVLNPSKFLPASCVLFPGISCSDFKINTTDITIIARNGLGDSLNPMIIQTPNSSTVCGATIPSNSTTAFVDGAQLTFRLTCGAGYGTAGSKLKTDLVMTYTTSAGVVHSRTGSIVSQIE